MHPHKRIYKIQWRRGRIQLSLNQDRRVALILVKCSSSEEACVGMAIMTLPLPVENKGHQGYQIRLDFAMPQHHPWRLLRAWKHFLEEALAKEQERQQAFRLELLRQVEKSRVKPGQVLAIV